VALTVKSDGDTDKDNEEKEKQKGSGGIKAQKELVATLEEIYHSRRVSRCF
jgi:hypothetical protein